MRYNMNPARGISRDQEVSAVTNETRKLHKEKLGTVDISKSTRALFPKKKDGKELRFVDFRYCWVRCSVV